MISAVGHETDRTLLDDVAAVACSTPTHAAEAAVPLDCGRARADMANRAVRLNRRAARPALQGPVLGALVASLSRAGAEAVGRRGRRLAALARVPAERLRRERLRLHQDLREVRAAALRGLRGRDRLMRRLAVVVDRKARVALREGERARAGSRRDAAGLERAAYAVLERRHRELERAAVALRAHDPERTLERGYALVEDPDGRPLTSATAAVRHATVSIRFADGRLRARPESPEPTEESDQ